MTNIMLFKLSLIDFRNYPSLNLQFSSRYSVVTGQNGIGKTNLLEAISFLSPGRGLRRATLSEVKREGVNNGFVISAGVNIQDQEIQLGTGTLSNIIGGDISRRLKIDGVVQKTTDALTDYLRVVWITPQMDGLFTASSLERRRFLDRLVLTIDPMHGQRSLAYERAMKGRNRLFEDRCKDGSWYDGIESQLAQYGTAIAAARAQLVGLLAGMMEKGGDDSLFPKADLALSGTLEEQFMSGRKSHDVEEDYRQLLKDNRQKDMQAGRTLQGPHRSDVLVFHRPKNMAASQSSTGEQKALLVGIILAHVRLVSQISGQIPILLLDEIAAHLDEERRNALFDIIDELGVQVFMTGTDRTLFSNLEGRAEFVSLTQK
jgi:DNA replication and repair protein RecF